MDNKAKDSKYAEQDDVLDGPPDMVTAAVARGRTLVIGKQRRGPGELVDLPREEHGRLLALGFLHNPNIPAPTSGPQFQGAVGGVVRPI